MQPFWIWRSHADITHEIGTRRVTPIAQLIGLRWPGGGWLWQFPLAVEIENEQGDKQNISIPDPTRVTVLFLGALALSLILLTGLIMWRTARPVAHKRS